MSKIKETYPTLDVTGRTLGNYEKFVEGISSIENYPGLEVKEFWKARDLNVKNNLDLLTNIAYSPDLPSTLRKSAGKKIQNLLSREGYKLPKSEKMRDGSFDGILGKETADALKKYKQGNKKQSGGKNTKTIKLSSGKIINLK